MVADFGVARALREAATMADDRETLTQLGTQIGTPAYMRPSKRPVTLTSTSAPISTRSASWHTSSSPAGIRTTRCDVMASKFHQARV
jgi:hypothetical protein